MTKAGRVCVIQGCPEIATHGSRCEGHKRPPRPWRPGRGSTRRWREIRKRILKRDEYQCTWLDADGNRCEETGELHVDHIIPVKLGGDDRPENLRVLCAKHNLKKGAQSSDDTEQDRPALREAGSG